MADFLHDKGETLIRYLDGEMDQTEKEMFESQLQKDMTLKERLESLRVAIASVQQYGTVERVKSIHSEMMQELSSVHNETKVIPMRRVVRYSLAIAASIIIILVGVNLFTSSQLSSNKLYNEAFVDYDASVVRGNESQTEIERLYHDRSYTNVIEKGKLQNVSQKDSLLVGLSYLKSNEVPDAINWLRSISVQNPVRQDAEFYLALSYLKNKNYKEALNLMQQIHSNLNHVYRNQFSEDYINKVKKLSSH
jgi:tetratricopeptide (TPR) repeat protein